MRRGLVQLAERAGDPPEPPREVEPEGDAVTAEYALVWFPFEEIAGYRFDCPDCRRAGQREKYGQWEDRLVEGRHDDTGKPYVAMRNVFGFVWSCPLPPLIIKEASDGRFYVVRHNRLYCALRAWDRLDMLPAVPGVWLRDGVAHVPVRIAHPTDTWTDFTRAALVHPIEQVDRDISGAAWLEPPWEAVWPCGPEEIWRR